MKEKELVAVDFETKGIVARPDYPPEPVGVAIAGPGIDPVYMAWGHPDGNNCTKRDARDVLVDLYKRRTIVFHNSAFDTEVGHDHLGLPFVPDAYEDTMFLAFLVDPRADLSLKPLAEKWLNLKPSEQDKLRDWILANIKEATPKTWGAYIAYAPVRLVGPYAIGDVKRTLGLCHKLTKVLKQYDKKYPPGPGCRNVFDAYQKELELMPILQRMERAGIPIAMNRVKRDLPQWIKKKVELEKWIVSRLGGARKLAQFANDGEPFNVGSSKQLADALDAAGKMSGWVMTAKGNRSTSKKNLPKMINDKKLLEAITRRNIYDKYVSTYGEKWLRTEKIGYVYPHINQVRNREDEYRGAVGARTGRLSYSDSWQAIPAPDRRPFPDLPNLRDYVIPPDGSMIAVRDYTQQEFRILAHYEDGPLLKRYQKDPFIDMHQEAKEMILELTGRTFDRRPVKDTGFGLIYGMGLETTAEKTKLDLETAKELRKSYLKAIPGLKELIDNIKEYVKNNEPIRTWGGRLYWCEEPKIIKGQIRTFGYKMINILIQGSAADCTKQAMINVDKVLPKRSARLLIQVHDELVMLTDSTKLDKNMKLLREAMEDVPFDVQMLSDGKVSKRSWGVMKPYDDRRKK